MSGGPMGTGPVDAGHPPGGPVTGVILAGGNGTRLAPLTDRTSKQLLPIGGEPLVARVTAQLARAGVADVLVVIDERHAGGFLDALRDGRRFGLRSLAYVWQPPDGRGMPSAIAQAERHLRTDKFLVACGDVLIEPSLAPAVADFAAQRGGARILATRTPDTAGYTPLLTSGARVTGIPDKDPARHGPGLMDLGCYLYHRDVFDEIRALRPSARGETEIWDLNRVYARRGRLACTEVTGWWTDVGSSLDTYRRADARYGLDRVR
ncbi:MULTISPECIES: sugar phosphate nucleotidyltransferase [Thermomonosporaceae]|uniref:sugar phosphate nucleotidyltransferase n=1 Tax=Thermomonosporaceae TaxID=2012 RepID=UPI00255AA25B|nr:MULTISPECIES: sugar phosphate nucleotidyltransferase [Thermomonosporaceae]MDL4776693.1 sugar phosphate nucleotidyltransferase [Actinomadura xylanilytica]